MNTPKYDNSDQHTLRQSNEIDPTLKAEASHTEWGPPASVARLSPEERLAAEAKVKRKIDFRLLPSLVVMYILSISFPKLY